MQSLDDTTYKKIPLYNRAKAIIDYTLVSNEDYDNAIKYKWSRSIVKLKKTEYKRVQGIVDKKIIILSHFIYGKPEKKNVIDHINNDPLDNRRENLQSISKSQNAQNKKKIARENMTSKYIGVSYDKINNKWRVSCANKNIGLYDTELNAATIFDKYAYIKFGEKASTNKLINYNDVKNLTINDIIKPKVSRELPNNIHIKRNNYVVEIAYKKLKYRSIQFKTVNEALKQLEIFKNEIKTIKNNEEIENQNKEIIRDINGNAIIKIYNKNKEFVDNIIIDDDKWHELMKYSYSLRGGHVRAYINSKKIELHRYLMNAPENFIVDHINNEPLDNRVNNLRISTDKQNTYNTKKRENTLSKFKGIVIIKNSKKTFYRAKIDKNYIRYNLGKYDIEIQAALAYNLKAKDLFGEFANLNEINIDNETINKYTNEILEQWNKIITN